MESEANQLEISLEQGQYVQDQDVYDDHLSRTFVHITAKKMTE